MCWLRSVYEGSAQGKQAGSAVMPGGGGGGSFRAGGFMQWNLPFAAPSATTWIAMFAQRHFYEFGTTREQLAQIALNARKNAGVNPNAIYRDPMTMDDYFDARMISSPLCLFDCDVPCDGGTAVIVSHADTVADLRKPPINVEAVGTAPRAAVMGPVRRPRRWCRRRRANGTRTDIQPSDVQLAGMCDGFSFITMSWLAPCGSAAGRVGACGRAAHRATGARAEHAGEQLSAGRCTLRVPPRGVRSCGARRGSRCRGIPKLWRPQAGTARRVMLTNRR
jgi:hypothetical protein